MSYEKTAIVTGGSRGIGASIVKALSKSNYKVVFCSRNKFNEYNNKNILGVQADVRKRSEHDKLVKTAIDWTGRLDVYINNAGISIWKKNIEVDEEFLDLILDTNLKGLYWGCQAAANHFIESNTEGHIINISSLASKRGSANNSVYCASKFGVNGVTQALAKELGPRNIRVNAICPVYVETETIKHHLKDNVSPTGGKDVQTYLDDFAKNNAALKRLPLSNEIADVCLFLASSNSSAIAGQCINVDCGVLPS